MQMCCRPTAGTCGGTLRLWLTTVAGRWRGILIAGSRERCSLRTGVWSDSYADCSCSVERCVALAYNGARAADVAMLRARRSSLQNSRYCRPGTSRVLYERSSGDCRTRQTSLRARQHDRADRGLHDVGLAWLH